MGNVPETMLPNCRVPVMPGENKGRCKLKQVRYRVRMTGEKVRVLIAEIRDRVAVVRAWPNKPFS